MKNLFICMSIIMLSLPMLALDPSRANVHISSNAIIDQFKAKTSFEGVCNFTYWGSLQSFEGNFNGLAIKDFESFVMAISQLEKLLDPFTGLASPDTFKLSKQEQHVWCGTGLPDDWKWIPADHTTFVYKQKGHPKYEVELKHIGVFALSWDRAKKLIRCYSSIRAYELEVEEPRLSVSDVLEIVARNTNRSRQDISEPKVSLYRYAERWIEYSERYKTPLDFFWHVTDGFYNYKISDRWGKICEKIYSRDIKASHPESYYTAIIDSIRLQINWEDAKYVWAQFWDDGGIRSLSISYPSLIKSDLGNREKVLACFQKVRHLFDQAGYELVFDETWSVKKNYRWIIRREQYDTLIHDYDCLTCQLDEEKQLFYFVSYLAIDHNLNPPTIMDSYEAKTKIFEQALHLDGMPWEMMSPTMKRYREFQFTDYPFYLWFYPEDPIVVLYLEPTRPYGKQIKVYNRPRIYREAWVYSDSQRDGFAAVDAVTGNLFCRDGINNYCFNVERFLSGK